MPLLRLIAEGVGPFERLDVDLSDGKGNPHLGPHIFAGVNGSGKSTVLRTLAWVMDWGASGFRHAEWRHLLTGHQHSRAATVVRPQFVSPSVWACTRGVGADPEFGEWITSVLSGSGFGPELFSPSSEHIPESWASLVQGGMWVRDREADTTWFASPEFSATLALFSMAAYAPSRSLGYLKSPDLNSGTTNARLNSMAFESTVQNESVQAWLLGLFSKRAIARERQQPSDEYSRSLKDFETALRLICDQEITFDVEIEPVFQPKLRIFGRSLNFSQLPDGVRSTAAWIADFMMRQDLIKDRLGDKRAGVLLLDEVDAHLHPLWQRRLLPAMRKALPDVQILVTSHSPFVISSCPGSRVHVLELDDNGRAHARPPVDSPIGESVMTTLKEIFGVDSRFDVLTERELDEWNILKRSEVAGSLSASDRSRLEELTITLADRSEELRSIVASPLTIPESVLRSLTVGEMKPHPIKRKKRA
jgi:hypothetical protein